MTKRGTTHMASLEFPPETGLILRCTRKSGNPFQRKQGNRLSCRDQEGRRGSDEVVPYVMLWRENREDLETLCVQAAES